MAETERDETLSRAYRGLGAEEPPRALDEAILAAARRRPARWRLPLAVAAVLVLAVGVTLRMLPHQPEAEPVALAPSVIETPRPAAPPPEQAAKAARATTADAVAARAPEATVARSQAHAPAEPSAAEGGGREAAAAGAVQPRARALAAAKLSEPEPGPEKWLERIAELKKQGREREAQESLAEFRKRYPGHKIPEALLR
jgi:hypothetical protein